MAQPTAHSAPVRRPPVEAEQGALARGFGLLAKAVVWLLASLILSILIEWAGLIWWWPEQGLDHSRGMLAAEVGYLDRDFRRSVVTSSPARFAQGIADATYHYLFEATGFVAFLRWAEADPATTTNKLQPYLHAVVTPARTFILAAMTITQVFSLRVAILTLALPAFVLAGLAGMVDGLVQRDLRRWGGGRESSFLYHHAKRTVLPTFVVAWILYLALPVSVHPSLVILPFAALFGVSVAVTTSTFKKYL